MRQMSDDERLEPQKRFKIQFWKLFFCWLPMWLVSVFIIGFRFDYFWAVFVNVMAWLYWPVLIPVAFYIDYLIAKKKLPKKTSD